MSVQQQQTFDSPELMLWLVPLWSPCVTELLVSLIVKSDSRKRLHHRSLPLSLPRLIRYLVTWVHWPWRWRGLERLESLALKQPLGPRVHSTAMARNTSMINLCYRSTRVSSSSGSSSIGQRVLGQRLLIPQAGILWLCKSTSRCKYSKLYSE